MIHNIIKDYPPEYQKLLLELHESIQSYGDIVIEDDHPVAIMIDKWIRQIKDDRD